MSSPSVRRMVALIPFDSSTEANFEIASFSGPTKSRSFTALTGMRFTCMGIVSVRLRSLELSKFARASAAATESFLPAISVYSKDILLPVTAKYRLQASSNASIFHFLFIGIISLLVLSSDA